MLGEFSTGLLQRFILLGTKHFITWNQNPSDHFPHVNVNSHYRGRKKKKKKRTHI